jgi:hypothetical protein
MGLDESLDDGLDDGLDTPLRGYSTDEQGRRGQYR